MSRRQQLAGEDPLEVQFRQIEEQWNSYKKSAPRSRRSRSATDFFSSVTTHIAQPFDDDDDEHAAEDVVSKQRVRARSRKIQGRNLMEALESVKDNTSPNVKEEVCSVYSSVLIQESGRDDKNSSSSEYSSSSFSSSLASLSGEVREEEVSSGRGGSRGRWIVRIVWIYFGLLLFTLISAVVLVEFGEEDYGEYMVPT